MILALLTALSIWLSAGTLAVTGGDTQRIAALPSLWILGALAIVATAAARVAKLRPAESWPLAISLLLWLPFLPGPIPPAFLLWQGPIEGIVWLLVIAGLIAVRRPVAPKLFTDPAAAPAVASVMLALSALLVFSQVRGVVPGGDEPHYLAATQSLLHDADLRVANNYANGEYLDYFPGRLEPHFLKRSSSGEIYSIHAPGVSAIVLPAFAVAGYAGAVVTIILIAAITAALAWRIAWRVSGSVSAAWISVLAVFGTAPYFFHTFTVYPEIIGGCIVTVALWVLLNLSEGRDVRPRTLLAVGAALAVLPWLHTRFAVLAALFGLIITIRLALGLRPRQAAAAVAAFLVVPVIAGAAWFAFFWLIWGSANPTVQYGGDTSTHASYILRGLIGLLFDQQAGVLTTAPVYVIAFAGVVELFKRQRRLTIELLTIAVVYAVTVASYQMWWAGSAAPARFLVSILPLAALPIAVVAAGSLRTLVVLLLLVSASLMFPRAFVEGGRLIFNSRGSLDPTVEWLSHMVNLPLALPSVHRDGGSIAIRDGAVWLAALFVGGVAAKVFKRTIALNWTLASVALAVSAMVATTVVWSLHHVSPVTPDRSKLAAVGAYRPAWQSPGFLERISIELPRAVRLDRVPAGDYEITPAQGAVAFVGRNDPPIISPQLGTGPFRLRLPVSLQTLNIRVDQPSTLRPISVIRPAVSRNAVRASSYGHTNAFVFDQWAYLEPDGFWTRANGTAEVVLDSDDANARQAGLPISITAGAVGTTIELSTGSLHETFSLTPGQRRDVVLPPAESGVWPVRIRSGAGFRPSEREPGNPDVRMLAAWIKIR